MWLIIVLFFYINVTKAVPDECLNYKTLPEDRDRSRNNTLAPPDPNNIPCDDAFTGWYRLHSGVIATSCVPENHCGTSSPIWMKDPIPGIGQTRENKFCVDHKSSHGEPCCLFSFNINVTNCGGYLVYDLKGGDLLCPSGYCTENVTPCPAGRNSFTGFEPCTDSHPVMDGVPILSAPAIINNGQDFSQTCSVNYSGTVGEFKLEWFFDGVLYDTVILTNGTRAHSLRANNWTGHVGQNLECRVTSYYIYGNNSSHSQPLMSNSYLGTITISPDTLTVAENGEEIVKVISTLPLVCPNTTSISACTRPLNVNVVGPNKYGLLVKNGCSVEMRGDDWDPVSNTCVTNITLAKAVDILMTTKTEYLVNFNLPSDGAGHDMWESYRTDDILVSAEDRLTHLCIAYGESHVVSNIPGKTNILHPGDFLLYTDMSNDGNFLQVQVRLWTPFNHGPSICAVAVQYNEALVIVDMCTTNVHSTAPVITQGDSNPDDLRVYLCGATYRIWMGDATRITVYMHEHNLDVKLELPPVYKFDKDEACKFFSPKQIVNIHDLLPFVLNVNTSLFGEAGKRFFEVKSEIPAPSTDYCTCGTGVHECDPFMRVKDPLCTMMPNKQMRCKSECMLVVPGNTNPEAGQFHVQDPTKTGLPKTNWPHKISNDEVNKRCSNALLHHVSPRCASYNVAKNIPTESCKEDYVMSGGFTYIDSSVLAFQWSCEQNLFTKSFDYYTLPDGRHTLIEPLLYQICPDLCNDRGACHNGTCNCRPGYGGNDCSIEENRPPTILDVKGKEVCQLSNEYCLTPIFVTRNVKNSLKLIMKLKHTFPVDKTLSQTVYYVEPVYENKYSVSLPMTHLLSLFQEHSIVGFSVSISNDGVLFSKPVSYHIYDDTCLFCDKSIELCVQKEETCHIDGSCYIHGHSNPNNASQICNPQHALIHWSEVTGMTPLSKSTPSSAPTIPSFTTQSTIHVDTGSSSTLNVGLVPTLGTGSTLDTSSTSTINTSPTSTLDSTSGQAVP